MIPNSRFHSAAWRKYSRWGQRVLLLAVLAALASPAWSAGVEKRLNSAAQILRKSFSSSDWQTPNDLINRSQCVGVFPSVWRGALLFGGRYGKGVVTCRAAAGGWTAPAAFRIEGGNVGLQIGGDNTDIVLFFLSDGSIDKLLRTSFTIGVDVSATAGPVGRGATGQTDALLGVEIVSYSHSRGLFAGLALDGATLRPDHKANRNLYGFTPLVKGVLRGGVEAPAAASDFLGVLAHYSPAQKKAGDD